MDGEECNNENTNNQKVNYKGTDWIICRSKTHNRLPYYFNTLTKESVWNLNEAEIEKAKRYTKSIENQMENIECPEPKEPPLEVSGSRIDQHNAAPPKIYSSQIIANRFPESLPFPPFMTSAFNQVLPYNPITHNPAQINLNVPTQTYNANIWAIPPMQSVFIAPGHPIISQAHTSVNVNYHDPDASVVEGSSMSRQFQVSRRRAQTPPPSRYTQANWNHSRHKTPTKGNRNNYNHTTVHRNFKQELYSNDLRNVLCAKATHKISQDDSEVHENEIAKNQQARNSEIEEKLNAALNETNQASNQSQNDSNWLEDVKDSELNLCVSKLKKLAKPEMKPDSWFIAADKDIILDHLNFLNILINADDECRLMVPKEVMEKLRLASRASCGMPFFANKGRRAVIFLTQLLKSGKAVLGEPNQDSSTRSTSVHQFGILRCCLNLVQQKYHVVLLSNNKELHEIKDIIYIPVFTMEELDQVLSVTDTDKCSEKIPIEITVINDFVSSNEGTKSDKEVQTLKNVPMKDQCISVDADVELQQDVCLNKEESQAPLVVSKTCDAAVQTEASKTELCLQQTHTDSSTNTSNTQNSLVKVTSLTRSNSSISQPEKSSKKERRLIRSTSHQINKTNENVNMNQDEKKQFKWRRRRDISSNKADNPTSIAKESCPGQDGQNDEHEIKSRTNVECATTQTCNTSYEDNLDGSEASSFIHRNFSDKVVIEETSTSGVISNTTSHADSETESIKHHSISLNNLEEEIRKNIMFEIVDNSMEEYLRMRCDELVSRFVQIMEEALTQILQQKRQLIQNKWPPPWTLHEAAKCLKMAFYDDHHVVDAADKLLNILLVVSDTRERINMNMKPSEYMEMYSFGVYLIDILQSTSANCDDLETAAQSLINLFSEISNPNTRNTDTFCDHTAIESYNHQEQEPYTGETNINDTSGAAEPPTVSEQKECHSPDKAPTDSYNNSLAKGQSESHDPPDKGQTESYYNSPAKEQTAPYNNSLSKTQTRTYNDSPAKGQLESCNSPAKLKSPTYDNLSNKAELECYNNCPAKTRPERYNLRSRNNIETQDNRTTEMETNEISPQQNDAVSFVRNIDIESDFFTSLHLQKITSESHSNTSQINEHSQISNPNGHNLFNVSENLHKMQKNNDCSTEPKIIRQFSKCPEFEERLYKKKEAVLDPLDFSENGEIKYNQTDSNENHSKEETHGTQINHVQIKDVVKTYNNEKIDADGENPKFDINANKSLNLVYNQLFLEIKKAFLEVYSFCEKTQSELCKLNYTSGKKTEKLQQVEKAYLYINNLLRSLKSILHRQEVNCENNLHNIMKQLGFEDISELHISGYRETVAKCVEQGKILLDSIDLIRCALKTK